MRPDRKEEESKMTGIQVAWEDVFSVLAMIRGHLIGIAAGLVILIAVLIAAKRAGKPKKGLIRKQAVLAFMLFLVLMEMCIRDRFLGKWYQRF